MSKFLPSSGNTVNAWILWCFAISQQALKVIPRGIPMVHFSFDLWSSPDHWAFLGVVGHWVPWGRGQEIQSALLGFKRFRGAHSGENQGKCPTQDHGGQGSLFHPTLVSTYIRI